MEQYIVVTLGPIFDTINLASSPAALWAGSYLFSYLNKTICRLLTERGVAETDILAPYYTAGADTPKDCDGVGLFHDRIIFRAGAFRIENFSEVRDAAIDHLAEAFSVERMYLQEYLLIRAAVVEAENPILDTSNILDCLELARPIVSGREDNPLLSMLVGDKNYGNEGVKNLPVVRGFADWQLRKPGGSLKSIPDIAGCSRNASMKKHHYYAIVRADGDRMGQVIAELNKDQIRDFSRKCIFYCAKVAGLVGKFGGVAIYSGGDDLLAIMPCENQQGETVFEFVRQANGLFAGYFPEASLSFGVTICYHKYPLYEALEDSQKLLFADAKSSRNCMAVRLQKHAGQSVGLLVPNQALDAFLGQYSGLAQRKDDEWLHTIHHKLKLFRHLFIRADSDLQQIRNLFANLFDADVHTGNHLLMEDLPVFYHKMKTELQIESIADHEERQTIDVLCDFLRLCKFFVEMGGEEA